MSRVIRNIKSCTIQSVGGNATTITLIRELNVVDNTQFQPVGSDNEASPRKYVKWLDCSGTLVSSDPAGGGSGAFKGLNNCTLIAVGVDIDGGSNCTVTVVGVAFGQVGVPERWGEIVDFPMPFSGGSVTFA